MKYKRPTNHIEDITKNILNYTDQEFSKLIDSIKNKNFTKYIQYSNSFNNKISK